MARRRSSRTVVLLLLAVAAALVLAAPAARAQLADEDLNSGVDAEGRPLASNSRRRAPKPAPAAEDSSSSSSSLLAAAAATAADVVPNDDAPVDGSPAPSLLPVPTAFGTKGSRPRDARSAEEAQAALAAAEAVAAEQQEASSRLAAAAAAAGDDPAAAAAAAAAAADSSPILPAAMATQYADLFRLHNEYRKKHGNVPALTWDDAAATRAQQTVDTCIFDYGETDDGQNIAYTSDTVITAALSWAAAAWYEDSKAYNYLYPGSNVNSDAFTQQVWKSTTKIGCAVKVCPQGTIWEGGPAAFIACNYVPAGNFNGEYAVNVFPPAGTSLPPAPPAPPPATGVPANFAGLVKAHNLYRVKHQVKPLVWDSALATSANSTFVKGCQYEYTDQTAEGENMAWTTDLNVTRAALWTANSWYEEVAAVDWNDLTFSFDTSLFVQMVWKDTTRIGCAVMRCKAGTVYDLQTLLFSCRYKAPANYDLDNYSSQAVLAEPEAAEPEAVEPLSPAAQPPAALAEPSPAEPSPVEPLSSPSQPSSAVAVPQAAVALAEASLAQSSTCIALPQASVAEASVAFSSPAFPEAAVAPPAVAFPEAAVAPPAVAFPEAAVAPPAVAFPEAAVAPPAVAPPAEPVAARGAHRAPGDGGF